VRCVLYIVAALVLAAIQSALLRWVGDGAFSLALPVAVVVFAGLRSGNVEGAVTAAGVGYVVDLVTGGPNGLMTFLAVALFLFSRAAGAAVDVRGRVGFAVLTAVGVFAYGAAALGITDLVSPAEMAPGTSLLRRVGVEALLTGLASLLLYTLLRRIDALFAREESGLLQ
jgi:cell shape-determining protein MreD